MKTRDCSSPVTAVDSGAADSEFEVLFHLNYARLARFLCRMIEDPGRAEELAAETLWRFWQNHATHEAPRAWLYRTALHSGLDELRRRQRKKRLEAMLHFRRVNPTPEEIHHANQIQQQVRLVLSTMRRRDAELLILRSEGFSYQEIADIAQVNTASIGTLLRRAQETFRKEYEKRYGTEA